jgi:hypothetical protein
VTLLFLEVKSKEPTTVFNVTTAVDGCHRTTEPN